MMSPHGNRISNDVMVMSLHSECGVFAQHLLSVVRAVIRLQYSCNTCGNVRGVMRCNALRFTVTALAYAQLNSGVFLRKIRHFKSFFQDEKKDARAPFF